MDNNIVLKVNHLKKYFPVKSGFWGRSVNYVHAENPAAAKAHWLRLLWGSIGQPPALLKSPELTPQRTLRRIRE